MSYGKLYPYQGKVYLLEVSTQLHETYCELSERIAVDKHSPSIRFTLNDLLCYSEEKELFRVYKKAQLDEQDIIFSMAANHFNLEGRSL